VPNIIEVVEEVTQVVEVNEAIPGKPGAPGPENLVVGPTNTLTGPGLWIQTGLAPNGNGWTLWIVEEQ
jgi:hypothetical protein